MWWYLDPPSPHHLKKSCQSWVHSDKTFRVRARQTIYQASGPHKSDNSVKVDNSVVIILSGTIMLRDVPRLFSKGAAKIYKMKMTDWSNFGVLVTHIKSNVK